MLTINHLTKIPASIGLPLLLLVGNNAAYAQANVEVDSTDGLLSVRASNVSASELAAQLRESLGISVVVTGNTEARVNLDIVEEPFEKALAKLSPNNMLVRDAQEQKIIEVVLMMGESSAGGGNAEQFLPSGSPADEVISGEATTLAQEEVIDPGALRDPNRNAQAREAAGAARSDANLPNPAGEGQTAPQIDPATGLPIQ